MADKRSVGRMIGVGVVCFGVLAAAFAVAHYVAGGGAIDNTVAAGVEADLDKSDPGWRLTDLDAALPAVPEAENSAVVVGTVNRWLAQNPQPFDENRRPSPDEGQAPHRFFAEDAAAIAEAAKWNQPILGQARKLADLPRGRYPPGSGAALSPGGPPAAEDGQGARTVLGVLLTEAMAAVQEKKAGDALRMCRAAVNVGRSLANERGTKAILARVHCLTRAGHAAEYALSQLPGDDAELRALGSLLADEEERPWLVEHWRYERARLHDELVDLIAGRKPIVAEHSSRMRVTLLHNGLRHIRRSYQDEHAGLIALYSRAVAIARLPTPDQRAEEVLLLKDIGAIRDTTLFYVSNTPGVQGLGEANRRWLARLRALRVALALERYRLAKAAWPATLDDLVPAYLDRVPADPFDGKPLRYRRGKDGEVVVYAVGPDLADDGGAVALGTGHRLEEMRDGQGVPHEDMEPGSDVGFRLWDVTKRGQPPVERK